MSAVLGTHLLCVVGKAVQSEEGRHHNEEGNADGETVRDVDVPE